MRWIVFVLIGSLLLVRPALAQEADPVSVINVLSLVISLLVLLVGTLVLIITLLGYMRLARRLEAQEQAFRHLQNNHTDLKQKFAMQVSVLADAAEDQAGENKYISKLQNQLDEIELRQSEQQRAGARAIRAMSLVMLGERQYHNKDLKGARETYQSALLLSEQDPTIHYRLGYIYAQQGDLAAAEKALQTALNLDTNYYPALAALGYVYRRRAEKLAPGKDQKDLLFKAEAHLFKALYGAPRLLNEDGESWWVTLAGLYRHRDQADKAVEAYQRAAKITPTSPYPLRNLALFTGQNGDLDKMLEIFQDVEHMARLRVQASPNDYWPYADLLVARLAAGKIQEAEDTLNFTLKAMPPDFPSASSSLLKALEKLARLLPAQASHIETVMGYVRQAVATHNLDPIDAQLENTSFVIPFEGGLPAVGIRATNHDDARSLVRRLDMSEARPAVFILGGAGGMESDESQRIKPLIETALMDYAVENGLALVDGGTRGGVMQLVGEARRQRQAAFPLVGVAPYNRVKYQGHDNPEGYPLDPGHSHFVLTNDGDWGDETDMLVQMAHALSGSGECPQLGLVINGGAVVRQEVYRLTISERLRVPLLVLEGSGRFADTLATAYRTGETEDDDLRAIIQRGNLHFISLKDGPERFKAKLTELMQAQPEPSINGQKASS